jgi:hypothetical protein
MPAFLIADTSRTIISARTAQGRIVCLYTTCSMYSGLNIQHVVLYLIRTHGLILGNRTNLMPRLFGDLRFVLLYADADVSTRQRLFC